MNKRKKVIYELGQIQLKQDVTILEEHYKVVYRILEVVAKHKLFLYSEKYDFDKLYIKYLNVIR